jgi:conjugative relaxase-like TrwC/TraI family protein
MIRLTPIKDANAAGHYYGKTDGGYYMDGAGLRREVGGQFAEQLGLEGSPQLQQLTWMLKGLHPTTGEQLTARLVTDRIAGTDLTARIPKGVTEAIEGGDARVEKAVWDTLHETLDQDVEPRITTRVRKGGKYEDRVTGNMAWFGFEHPETRPVELDGMPRPDRHIHVVIPSMTWDAVEQQVKAIKWRPNFELRKWFSHRFDLRLSTKLAELGYEIDTTTIEDDKGGRKYHSWDVVGMPESMLAWDNQRGTEIAEKRKALEEKFGSRMGKVAADKLGAATRTGKRDDLTYADCRRYWDSQRTAEELAGRAECIRKAQAGENPKPASGVEEAVRYAVAHAFYRSSVVAYTDLEILAMERMMGRGLPEELYQEFLNQGTILKNGEATTGWVLQQEQKIIRYAVNSRGLFPALAQSGIQLDLRGLSRDQKAAGRHVWTSNDGMMLVAGRGSAGSGKTTLTARLRDAIAEAGVPLLALAPSADASRKVLKEEAGFPDANTVAAFLDGRDAEALQQKVKGGGILWIDEASLLPIDDLERLCDVARKLKARIVLMGDPMQHLSPSRHGNMLHVLHEFGGLPVAELKEIKRQKGDYADVVKAVRDGKWKEADARLRKLGWIVEGDGHQALVEEYARAIKEKKAVKNDGKVEMLPKSIIVVDPTHKDGDALSRQLRALRQAEGLIEQHERTFARLMPLKWSDAEKGDAGRYAGNEVIQFFRRSGPFKAGSRVKTSALLPLLAKVNPKHFQVYRQDSLALAKGDTIRLTAGGATKDGMHRVDNGRIDTVAGFTGKGDVVLANGWVLDKNFSHWKHGLVATSFAAQSRTEDIVLGCFNAESLAALGVATSYVTISRGRERGMIFTNLPREELLDAMARQDKAAQSATELVAGDKKLLTAKERLKVFAERMRKLSRQRQRRNTMMREALGLEPPERDPPQHGPEPPRPPAGWQEKLGQEPDHGLTR